MSERTIKSDGKRSIIRGRRYNRTKRTSGCWRARLTLWDKRPQGIRSPATRWPAAHGEHRRAHFEAAAAARMLAGKSADGAAGGRGKEKPSSKFDEGLDPNAGRTLTQVAAAVGMSRTTYAAAGPFSRMDKMSVRGIPLRAWRRKPTSRSMRSGCWVGSWRRRRRLMGAMHRELGTQREPSLHPLSPHAACRRNSRPSPSRSLLSRLSTRSSTRPSRRARKRSRQSGNGSNAQPRG